MHRYTLKCWLVSAGIGWIVLASLGCSQTGPLTIWPDGLQYYNKQPKQPVLAEAQSEDADDGLVRLVQATAHRVEQGVQRSPRVAPSQPPAIEVVGFDPTRVAGTEQLFVDSVRPVSTPARAATPAEHTAMPADVAGAAPGSAFASSSQGPPVVVTSGPIMPDATEPEPSAHTISSGSGGQAMTTQPPPAGLARPATPAGDKLTAAIAEMEHLATANPADFNAQLHLRMLYLAADRSADARAPWPGGSAGERRTLTALIEAAVAIGACKTEPGDATDPHEGALAAVENLRQRLAEQAALKVRAIRLASRVDGFGVLTPFDGPSLRPGQWVIVYCELENLTSRAEPAGLHRSELSLRAEVLGIDGRSVLVEEDKQVVDRSLNPRRDFFLARRLRLPADLAGGQYVVRVSVEDKLAGKVGESMLRFEVAQ